MFEKEVPSTTPRSVDLRQRKAVAVLVAPAEGFEVNVEHVEGINRSGRHAD
jgi:hypothetical protein